MRGLCHEACGSRKDRDRYGRAATSRPFRLPGRPSRRLKVSVSRYCQFLPERLSSAAIGSWRLANILAGGVYNRIKEVVMRSNYFGRIISLAAIIGLAALLTAMGPDDAGAQTRTTLDIYVVDVEGGNA